MEARADFGAVIFEGTSCLDLESHQVGFRCQSGNEPIRFASRSELPSNVTWLTNLPIDARALNVRSSTRLLNSRYMGVPVEKVLDDLGARGAAPSDQAYLLARMFSNVCTQAKAIFGVDDTGDLSLASQIAKKISPVLSIQPSDSDAFSLHASHGTQRCAVPRPQDTDIVPARVPRVDHAKTIIAGGLPDGAFVELEGKRLPKRPDRPRWLREHSDPLLAAINVTGIGKPFRALVEDRLGVSKSTRIQSSFAKLEFGSSAVVPSNEIHVLSQFCDFTVERVFICDGGLSKALRLPTETRIAKASYSYGLVAEALWSSLCRDSAGIYRRTPRTAWVHAADRMHCLKFAIALQSKGYAIASFGGGNINVYLRRDQRAAFADTCARLGLEVPMGMATRSPGGDTALPQALYHHGDLELLLELDDKFTNHCCSIGRSNNGE